MAFIKYLVVHFKNNKLVKNVQWMLLGEGVARASRLLTIIVLAAELSPADYGTAMLAVVCHELIRVVTRLGAGGKLIQCEEQLLTTTAANVLSLNWIVSLCLGLIQFFSADWIGSFFNKPELASLLQLMAVCYFIYPIVAIKVYLLQRRKQMKQFALCSAIAITVDNLSTAGFAVYGHGVSSVAYAKVLSALVWCLGFSICSNSSVAPKFNLLIISDLLKFSINVLCSELLKTLRGQVDLLIAAKIFDADMLGIYSFAKSAGVGLGQSLGNAYLACIYPQLAFLNRERKLSFGVSKIFYLTGFVALIFLIQSLLAQSYVPVLFDSQWQGVAILVSILCLTAMPMIFVDVNALVFRVQHHLFDELVLQGLCVVIFTVSILVAIPEAAIDLCLRMLLASFICLLISPLIKLRRYSENEKKRLELC